MHIFYHFPNSLSPFIQVRLPKGFQFQSKEHRAIVSLKVLELLRGMMRTYAMSRASCESWAAGPWRVLQKNYWKQLTMKRLSLLSKKNSANICSICNFYLSRPVLLFLDECISFGYFSLECDEPWSMGKIPLESCLQRKRNTKSQSSSKPRLELAAGSQENLNHLQSRWAQFHTIPIYFFIMAPFHPEVDDRHIGSKDRACSASDPPRAPLPGGQ